MTIVGVIIGILIGALFSGFIIWIVGRLGWGLEVDGFVPAYLAAIVIAVVSWAGQWAADFVRDEADGAGCLQTLVLLDGKGSVRGLYTVDEQGVDEAFYRAQRVEWDGRQDGRN